MVITWDYDPLVAVLFDSNQSLRGYYLHRAHLACAVPSKTYTTSRTSKPFSRLIKASCNPLSADEILSTTVPISIRCAFEIVACSRRFISASGRAPDSTGLFLLLSLGAECSRLRVAEGLPSGLGGSGEILHDDTSGSSAPGDWETGEAFRSPSSPEEDPPKTNSAEKGYDSNYKDICSGYCLQK